MSEGTSPSQRHVGPAGGRWVVPSVGRAPALVSRGQVKSPRPPQCPWLNHREGSVCRGVGRCREQERGQTGRHLTSTPSPTRTIFTPGAPPTFMFPLPLFYDTFSISPSPASKNTRKLVISLTLFIMNITIDMTGHFLQWKDDVYVLCIYTKYIPSIEYGMSVED